MTRPLKLTQPPFLAPRILRSISTAAATVEVKPPSARTRKTQELFRQTFRVKKKSETTQAYATSVVQQPLLSNSVEKEKIIEEKKSGTLPTTQTSADSPVPLPAVATIPYFIAYKQAWSHFFEPVANWTRLIQKDKEAFQEGKRLSLEDQQQWLQSRSDALRQLVWFAAGPYAFWISSFPPLAALDFKTSLVGTITYGLSLPIIWSMVPFASPSCMKQTLLSQALSYQTRRLLQPDWLQRARARSLTQRFVKGIAETSPTDQLLKAYAQQLVLYRGSKGVPVSEVCQQIQVLYRLLNHSSSLKQLKLFRLQSLSQRDRFRVYAMLKAWRVDGALRQTSAWIQEGRSLGRHVSPTILHSILSDQMMLKNKFIQQLSVKQKLDLVESYLDFIQERQRRVDAYEQSGHHAVAEVGREQQQTYLHKRLSGVGSAWDTQVLIPFALARALGYLASHAAAQNKLN